MAKYAFTKKNFFRGAMNRELWKRLFLFEGLCCMTQKCEFGERVIKKNDSFENVDMEENGKIIHWMHKMRNEVLKVVEKRDEDNREKRNLLGHCLYTY